MSHSCSHESKDEVMGLIIEVTLLLTRNGTEHGEELPADGHAGPPPSGHLRTAVRGSRAAVAHPLLHQGRRRAHSQLGGALDTAVDIRRPR